MPATPSELNAGLECLFEQLASLAENPLPADAGPAADPAAPAGPPRRAPAREDELPTLSADAAAVPVEETFFPAAPRGLADIHVGENEIEGIVLRLLMHGGEAKGVEISQQIGLPFPLTEKVLHGLKTARLLVLKNAATLSDYVYEITDLGLQRARQIGRRLQLLRHGAVSLDDYCASVAAQSLSRVKPRMESLPPRLLRPDDQPRNVRPPGPRHRLRAGALPARTSRQRQDEHRGTDHGRLWHEHLDPPRDQRVGGDHPPLRSQLP